MACRTSKRLYGAGLPLVLRKIVACTSKEPGRNEIDIFRQLSAFLSSGTGVDKLKHVRSLDLKTVGIASHEQDRKRVVQLLRSCMPHLESLSLILTDAWDPEGLWRCLSLSSGQLKELKLFLWLPGCTHMKWMDNPIPPSVERMVTFVTTSTAQACLRSFVCESGARTWTQVGVAFDKRPPSREHLVENFSRSPFQAPEAYHDRKAVD